MPIIPLTCPNCGGSLRVDSEKDAAICDFCRQPYIVKDAITKQYITNINNISADVVNIQAQEKDFRIIGGVLGQYNGESVNVVLPSSVKRIGKDVFHGSGIESVVIPDSVVEICGGGYYGAFSECVNLKHVTIPGSVIRIGDAAFRGCENLESVILEEGIESIGDKAFSDCKSLKEVIIPTSVTKLGSSAFWKCSSLQNVVFRGKVQVVGIHRVNSIDDVVWAFYDTPFEKAFRKKQAQEKLEQEQKKKRREALKRSLRTLRCSI